MPIVTVEHSRLVSTGNFCNVKYGATCTVEDGCDPGDAMLLLKAWVNCKFDQDESVREEVLEIDRARSNIRNLEYEQECLEKKLAAARATWERALQFLAKHGVDPDSTEDIPF